jgi:hypothetical protein
MPEKPAYIGPERRKNQRRTDTPTPCTRPFGDSGVDRRLTPDRRQDAVAGVIANMSGEDMLLLRELWERVEAGRRDYGCKMTYDEIIAREA